MKERVTIAKRPLKDGVVSLFLDYRVEGIRRRENLKLYLVPERFQSDKAKNLETMRIAKARRDEREYELEQMEAGVQVKARPRMVPFVEVAQVLMERKGVVQSTTDTIRHTVNYIVSLYPNLTIQECTTKWFTQFINKVHDKGLAPNTVYTYASIVRQVLRRACEDGIISSVPRLEMPKRIKSIRTFLTFDELKRLEVTPFRDDVKNAFLFCCFTGLRLSDCKALKPSMIHGDSIVLRQQKTSDVVRIPLTDNARRFLPSKPLPCGRFFKFSYSTDMIRQMCWWGRMAGIDKHITFHVSRHTFATLLITSGADVYATSKLLGHSSVSTTQVYAHMVDEVRRKSVELIPSLDNGEKED